MNAAGASNMNGEMMDRRSVVKSAVVAGTGAMMWSPAVKRSA
jgi:hypothetical protein